MVILTLMAASAWAAWKWQTNAYGQRLAQQETEHQTVLTDLANANSALIAVQCLPPPAPAAWFMEPREPNLTARMLNELSESPMMGIRD